MEHLRKACDEAFAAHLAAFHAMLPPKEKADAIARTRVVLQEAEHKLLAAELGYSR